MPATLRATLLITGLQATGEVWDLRRTFLIWLVGELIAVLFVLRVLNNRGTPAATMGWILFILVAPYLGLLTYYLLPRRIQMKRLRRRRQHLAWIDSTFEGRQLLSPRPSTGGDPIANLLRRLDGDAISQGNALHLIESGGEFFAQACAAIDAAKDFVHLETFIFRPDATGLALLQRLANAAKRGVEVRLLYDSIGSLRLRGRHLRELRRAGGHSAPSLPLLWVRRPLNFNLRNHRKLLIVDGEVAFMGGRNIANEYARDRFGKEHKWIDTMVGVRGPAVTRLQRTFVEDWYNATREDLVQRRYFPQESVAGTEVVGIIASGPDCQDSSFHWTMLQLIHSAQRTLDISSPYLVPHPTILTALQVAAVRGVRVRFYTNGRAATNWLIYHAQRSYYQDLLHVGVEIIEPEHDFNHSKMVLVDRRYFFIGSPNLDVRSVDLNFEIGLVTIDSPLCDQAAAVLDSRIATGRIMSSANLPTSLWGRALDGLCRLASPLL